jgi:hypothetical protein
MKMTIVAYVDGLTEPKDLNTGFEILKSMLTETEKAWLAGFVDGEGSITISKQIRKNRPSPAYRALIEVANTNKAPLEFIMKEYGGKIYHAHEKRRRKNGKKWSDAFTWYCPISVSERLLTDIFPYLRVKSKQAEIVLEFIRHIKTLNREPIRDKFGRIAGSKHLTKEELDYRESLYSKVRSLNQKSKGFKGGDEIRPS